MTGVLSALGMFEPTEAETRIFQTALNESGVAYDRLKNWDIVAYLAGPGKWMRGQLPLMYANVSDQLSAAPLPCRPYLKTATLREKKRYDVYLSCLTDALTVLNRVNLPFCVVKGVAAANTVYPQPFLRHCHDLDLVVSAQHVGNFVDALQNAGFDLKTGHHPATSSIRLDHPVGLPVMLHTQPVAVDHRLDVDWMMEGAVQIDTPAGQMVVPEPSRRILHAWLQRFEPDRFERHAWVPDTVLTVRQCDAVDIERLNSYLAAVPHLTEGVSAARYLAAHFDRMPQLKQLNWSPQAKRGNLTAPQRARFYKRALAQNIAPEFKEKLGIRMRALFAYDWVLPPATHFQSGAGNTALELGRQRFKRLFNGGRRRISRLVVK